MSKGAKRILFVFGTRPEAIKMAPVIKAARQAGSALDPVICVTGQHRRLLDQAMEEFGIEPDIDLNLMRPNQALGDFVSLAIVAIKNAYQKARPGLVLVQGDTSTVFAACLAAYYDNIEIGHIEAGLRSADIHNPFPEEINRRFASSVARYNFCPTQRAKKNLLAEAVGPGTIFVTGNTVVDSLEEILKKRAGASLRKIKGLEAEFLKHPYVLITGHRRENFGGPLRDVCKAVRSLAIKHRSVNWLWAVHLNPNVRKVVFGVLSGLTNVRIIEPPSYGDFACLMKGCRLIISDSGGVQEEAPSLGKRVLVTRACTERPEAVEAGVSILVGTDPGRINKFTEKLLAGAGSDRKIKSPFGDGHASERIIDVITKGRCREFCP